MLRYWGSKAILRILITVQIQQVTKSKVRKHGLKTKSRKTEKPAHIYQVLSRLFASRVLLHNGGGGVQSLMNDVCDMNTYS